MKTIEPLVVRKIYKNKACVTPLDWWSVCPCANEIERQICKVRKLKALMQTHIHTCIDACLKEYLHLMVLTFEIFWLAHEKFNRRVLLATKNRPK